MLAPLRDSLDLHSLLRPNDHVVVGQTGAEPRMLSRQLMRLPPTLPLTVFVGTVLSDTFEAPQPEGMMFRSYGAMGRAAALADRGVLDIVPERYGRLHASFEAGDFRADVVLLQGAGGDGGPGAGLANDYVITAARKARCVVLELGEGVPWTYGTSWPDDIRITHRVRSPYGPVEVQPGPRDAVSEAIARHVAQRVPDGATLQAGVGAIPDASLAGLFDHRRLGIHSGVLSDAMVDLIQRGAVCNTGKSVDEGISVTNTLYGSRPVYDFADRNRAIEVRHTSYTHAPAVLARLHALHAINGALEVDLSGQVNCESAGGRVRGGIGGLLDFARAARNSDHGCSITVLRSTARNGTVSRIVGRLGSGPATLGRSDVDTVITEWGVAELRNASLDERARRLIRIAAPQFRDRLHREMAQNPSTH